jgi:serine/threonine-protein kinase
MSTSPPVSSPVREGDVLARKYRVERVIGIGGMGVVVAATHVALHQRVALKFMLPAVAANGESIERFLREARAVARLRTEHVPRVLDVGTLETGEPYMVMELLEGQDLAKLLSASGPLSVADAIDYVRQACEALVEAHGLGIVHRDLKPDNLFLAYDARGRGQIKVLDFGISKSMGADAASLALTRTSAVMGSPLYMSPEQMKASRDVDARTDIWSLGITLYQLVVGEVPFQAESPMALGAKVLHELPTAPMVKRREITKALNDVILRCLEKDPARRYADAAALEQALARALEADPSAGADAVQLPLPAATTGPRVSLGAGGTPPSGSHTLPFSATELAHDTPVFARRATRASALAIVAVAVAGTALVVARMRPSGGASERAPGSAFAASSLGVVDAPSAPPAVASAPVASTQPAAAASSSPPAPSSVVAHATADARADPRPQARAAGARAERRVSAAPAGAGQHPVFQSARSPLR